MNVIMGSKLMENRYADDTVLFADSAQALQEIDNMVNAEGKNYELSINEETPKLMIISRDENPDTIYNNKQRENRTYERM